MRALNPHALFIGPVAASPNTGYITQFLSAVKASGNLPDLVSYHMYPCTDQSISTRPGHIGDYGRAAQSVNDAVQSVLGHTLPLAVTEWNYSWKPDQTPQNDPYIGTFTQQSIEAMAQARIAMANQFDLASNAGGGSLDLVHPQSGQGTPQLQAMQAMIQRYRTGIPLPTATTVQPTPVAATPTPAGTPRSVSNGVLLSAQQLSCSAPSAPLPPSSSPTATPTASPTPTPLPAENQAIPSPTDVPAANACNFLTQITTSDAPQQLVLT